MRAINHALTGTLIGLTVHEPLIAVPAAVLSHYVCDAIPHYGAAMPKQREIRSRLFRNLLYIDTVLCFGLVVILATVRPEHWALAAVCAFAAAAPDLASFNFYQAVKRHKPWRRNSYQRFAHDIQWFERPIGAVVEAAWFAASVLLIVTLLHYKNLTL